MTVYHILVEIANLIPPPNSESNHVSVREIRRDPFVILTKAIMLERQLTRDKSINAVCSDENIAASSELNTPVYNTVRFAIHKTIIP